MLTISIVHDHAVRRVIKNTLTTWTVHVSVAFQDVVAASLQAAGTVRVGICSGNGRAPADADLVLATGGRLVRVVSVGLPFAEEEVKVVFIFIQKPGLPLMHPLLEVADLRRAVQVRNRCGVRVHGSDVDVHPVGPPVHVVTAVDLNDGGVDGVPVTAVVGGDAGATLVRPRAVLHVV